MRSGTIVTEVKGFADPKQTEESRRYHYIISTVYEWTVAAIERDEMETANHIVVEHTDNVLYQTTVKVVLADGTVKEASGTTMENVIQYGSLTGFVKDHRAARAAHDNIVFLVMA